MANIKSIKNIGVCDAYDLEINHTNHQFYLSNGVLTSNSHAIFYSMLGFHTAYLKAHYPLEFLTANLMSEVNSNAKISKDNINKIKEEIRKLKINVLPPDINKSDVSYKIIDNNTLITGLDALKFIGKDAIPEIIKSIAPEALKIPIATRIATRNGIILIAILKPSFAPSIKAS